MEVRSALPIATWLHVFLLISLSTCSDVACDGESSSTLANCNYDLEDVSSMVQVTAHKPPRREVTENQLAVDSSTGDATEVSSKFSKSAPHNAGHLSPVMMAATHMASYLETQQFMVGIVVLIAALIPVIGRLLFPGSEAFVMLSCAVLYICVSAAMIETNKWLMMPGHFPYPLALTMSHMTTSFTSCFILYKIAGSGPMVFTAMDKIEVNWQFLRKFVPIGCAFALSIVCGNAAYKYMSVSFLQIMKQSNIVTIYIMSVVCGVEALKRVNVYLLLGVLTGAWLGVHGEMHFQALGFGLQVVSSLSEATKVILQFLLMSGSTQLDPLTMVMFMAPACLCANALPFLVLEGVHYNEIAAAAYRVAPMLVLNALMACALNCSVAICIKKLSAVGYLLCGIVKDVCIITSSAYVLGDSLTLCQKVGFTMALFGVFSYSLYKRNMDCFKDDEIMAGFQRLRQKLIAGSKAAETSTAAAGVKEVTGAVTEQKDSEAKSSKCR